MQKKWKGDFWTVMNPCKKKRYQEIYAGNMQSTKPLSTFPSWKSWFSTAGYSTLHQRFLVFIAIFPLFECSVASFLSLYYQNPIMLRIVGAYLEINS